MYILFLLMTPVVLTITRRVGWSAILAGSATTWFLAHLGVREAEHHFVNSVLRVPIPINEMGSFDFWAWQFLWILGLWFGVRWAQGNLPVEKWARHALIPAAIVAAVLLPLRYAVGRGIELGAYEPLFDKWHFGVVRLINFAAVATLLIRFQSVLKPLAVRPLVLLGATLGAMLLTAKMFSKSETKTERKGDHAPEEPRVASPPGLSGQQNHASSVATI